MVNNWQLSRRKA